LAIRHNLGLLDIGNPGQVCERFPHPSCRFWLLPSTTKSSTLKTIHPDQPRGLVVRVSDY
jgi:hypothetical protein